jgi:hypothetical protein
VNDKTIERVSQSTESELFENTSHYLTLLINISSKNEREMTRNDETFVERNDTRSSTHIKNPMKVLDIEEEGRNHTHFFLSSSNDTS